MLKNIVFITAFLLSCFTVCSQGILEFKTTRHNFKFIRQGDTVSYAYAFKNSGDKPISINNAKFECSCTSVKYPEKPIMPGDTASVIVTFDSKDAIDRQEREVIIESDAKNSPVRLVFKAVVLKPKKKNNAGPE